MPAAGADVGACQRPPRRVGTPVAAGVKPLKLQKFELSFKIFKNESCRLKYELQVLQRATYVLSNGLAGNVYRS
jgi:hypothetical protein